MARKIKTIPPKGSGKKLIINVMQVIDAVSSF